MIRYRYASIQGRAVFYREAGDAARPSIVLLHGLPSSSHMFRHLIPLLADRFHVVALDYIGFGYSDAPAAGERRDTESEVAARRFLAAETTNFQYQVGAMNADAISPASWTHDQALLDRPRTDAYQLDLFADYNPTSRSMRPGRQRSALTGPGAHRLAGMTRSLCQLGAEAFRRDIPDAKLVQIEGGHFVLDEHSGQIAADIKETFAP